MDVGMWEKCLNGVHPQMYSYNFDGDYEFLAYKNRGGCHIERQDKSYACVAAALAD